MVQSKRRVINYSIKRQMQFRLLSKVMLITFVATGLAALFFYFYSNREVGQSFEQFHVHAKIFLDFLLPAIIIALFAGVIAAFGIALFFPIKIAGPLYRMERDLKEKVGEGDLTVKFSVRKGDEVQDLSDALNSMVGKLRSKIERIKITAEELSSCSAKNDRGEGAIKEIDRLAKRLEEVVKEFKI